MSGVVVGSGTQRIIVAPPESINLEVVSQIQKIVIQQTLPDSISSDGVVSYQQRIVVDGYSLTPQKIVVNSPVSSVAVINAGPVGPPGPPGTPGGEGDAFRFVHDQIASSTTWTINHNLNGYPQVTIFEPGSGDIVEGEISYLSSNQIVVEFSVPLSGKAYLS